MTSAYQHLFDAAAQEAGNLYGQWRALAQVVPLEPAACLAVEARLKRQLALLALAPAPAGLQAVRRAVETGGDSDWLAAGWFCAGQPAELTEYITRATPAQATALAAGVACAPTAQARDWRSKWSQQPQHTELLLALRIAFGEVADQRQFAWRGPPVAPAVEPVAALPVAQLVGK